VSINSQIIKNEDGTSLVEVVASIVLLAVLLPSAAYLFVFSQSVIRNNQVRSDAIQVAEDIKQNFEYRSQTQDWADLNRISLVNFHEETKEDEMLDLRKKHLILDNTGVEYSKSDEPLYGEYLIQEKDEKRGDFIRMVTRNRPSSQGRCFIL
jgi:type II secretory pathway pseudopilin PulG